MLSNVDIEQALYWNRLKISDLQEYSIQPASVELHLGSEFKVMKRWGEPLDLIHPPKDLFYTHPMGLGIFKLYPGDFALAHTVENIKLDNTLVARVEGKSSLGRMGLAIHVTAGFIDPGFEGQITLELVNHTGNILILTPGMKIAQLAVMEVISPSDGLYGDAKFNSHYQGQKGATIGQPVR